MPWNNQTGGGRRPRGIVRPTGRPSVTIDSASGSWTIEPDRSPDSDGHSAPFPVGLPMRCIRSGCKPGGIVLDPFAGSGTTCEAARKLGRKAVGIDRIRILPADTTIG